MAQHFNRIPGMRTLGHINDLHRRHNIGKPHQSSRSRRADPVHSVAILSFGRERGRIRTCLFFISYSVWGAGSLTCINRTRAITLARKAISLAPSMGKEAFGHPILPRDGFKGLQERKPATGIAPVE
jgi:hypothetical protein